MSHKVRLGPIAIFLIIVAMVLATLAMLTVATAGADKALAKRFAQVTQIRYDLEAEGQQFLRSYDEQAQGGMILADELGLAPTATGYTKSLSRDGYTLQIRVSRPDAEGNYEIEQWKVNKDWNEEDPFNNIWDGGF